MPLTAGVQLGAFTIISPIGAGGMGEVYRARDAKLGRDVALKLLPEAMAYDVQLMARFEREAHMLASLNHPHIAAIHGVEETDGHRALVMELVEGQTMADRIAGGPIPLEEALFLALGIADALAYAHDKGIVHRDLKPANIKVTPDERVKILDFGLAKAMTESSGSSPDSTTLPVTTNAGMVLGTAAYMSPEQARGQEVDRRTDVWSFGVVVYEMLTGDRPFGGLTVSDTLSAVLRESPDLERVPVRVRQLVSACLEKDPRKRLRDLGDVRLLTGAASGEPGAPSITEASQESSRRPLWPRALLWAGAAMLFTVVAVFALAYFRAYPKPEATIRSLISPPEGESFAFIGFNGGPLLSPDGARLVFPAWDASGNEALWMRPLDSLTAERLEGTEGASYPFWSPDSQHVAFFQDGKLKKINATGGPPVLVCDAPNPRGGTWGRADLIVFASRLGGGFESVPASGGKPAPVASRKGSGPAFSNRWPEFLPDGKHFLYLSGDLSAAGTSDLGIYIGEIGSSETKFLLQADSDALYVSPGYLLFLRGETLMAQRFDADDQKLVGEVLPVAQHVASPALFRQGLFSVSGTGLLVYETAATHYSDKITWFDDKGKQLAEIGEPGAFDLSLSPDGKQLAYVMQKQTGAKNDDIWLMDLQRGVQTRFTFGPADNKLAVWSPDGARIAYSANHQARYKLYVASASGSGVTEPLIESDADEYPTDWSRDGRYIALTFSDWKGQTNDGIWVLPLFGDHKPFPYLQSPFNKTGAVFSPDGRWLAYASDESGKLEVYLSPFPNRRGKWQVSRGGGDQPEWNRDGNTLYYVAPGGKMIEASVKENGATVVVGEPRQLFQQARGANSLGARSYCVTRDGSRFLVAKAPQNVASPLTLVTNWSAHLKQ
jgi:serine/threonine protein kinase